MTPSGERGFGDIASAKAAAMAVRRSVGVLQNVGFWAYVSTFGIKGSIRLSGITLGRSGSQKGAAMANRRLWLSPDELPLLASSTGEKMEKAFQKRLQVVEWLNFEIKKAFVELKRQMPPERFYMLKKFATSIRTNARKTDCEYWIRDIDAEDLYCEYVAGRSERQKEKAGR